MHSLDHTTQLLVNDLLASSELARHVPPADAPTNRLTPLHRLSQVLTAEADLIAQELAGAALDLCGADSAGICLEAVREDGGSQLHWIVTAGDSAPFQDTLLPRYFAACQVCLANHETQSVRVSAEQWAGLQQPTGVPVADGMMLPWVPGGLRCSLWVLSAQREGVFHKAEYDLLKVLADGAAIAYTIAREHDRTVRESMATGAAIMAHTLAHQINNPLQSLTNTLYLAENANGPDAAAHYQQAREDLDRLSALVRELLGSGPVRGEV